jgi:Rv0078B-related antitoxin
MLEHGDTSPDVAKVLLDRSRRMTPGQRVAEGVALCKLAREVMRAGIRRRHPDYDEECVELALSRLLWGDDLWQKVHPDRALIAP